MVNVTPSQLRFGLRLPGGNSEYIENLFRTRFPADSCEPIPLAGRCRLRTRDYQKKKDSSMPRIEPLAEADAQDKTAQTYGRIREMLGSETVPEPFLHYGRVQPFLQDFYMNFKKFVYTDGKIDAQTKAIIGLAVSSHYGCGLWLDFLIERAKSLGVTDGQVGEVIAVASTNAMYNSFFKFRDFSGSDIFSGMSVGLRAHTFTSTSLTDETIELINVAISNLNACKPCTSAHVEKSRQLGLSDEALLETIQCAATMGAGCAFLKAAGV